MGSFLGRPATPTVMDEGIKIMVDSTISKSKVVVFSKTYCPYCKRAKALITKFPIKPDQLEIIEIEKRPDCSSIQAYLKEITGASTVPRIFIDGKCIGGCDDAIALDNSGELEKLLSSCGALQSQ
ncbi:glutaredoxin-1 [Tetranychus urticae]|uniref:Glutaredoxin-1 n=1 Tax=Tetranychus urticae TaxID=32264 RepID=T1KCC3_TETUR|nr:glutaredoxin-1 [Tetranychus urticae]